MNTQTLSHPTPTVQMLRQVQAAPAFAADGLLAATLLNALQPAPNGNALGYIATLAGEWLDSLLAEPEVPPAFAPELESLRWVVVKTAVSDPMFFAEAPHPLRKMVDALMQRAAFAHLQDRSLEPVCAELREAASHSSIQSQFVLDALPNVQRLDAAQAQPFCAQIAKERDLRREGLLHQVRRFVEQQIESRTLDIALSAQARSELMRAFQPLLTTLMLRYGAAGPSSRWAQQLLERFVDSFSDGTSARERQSLRSALCETLREACLPASHMQGIAAEMDRVEAVRPPQRRAGFTARLLSD